VANTIYNWADIGVNEINNLYLYGTLTKPASIDFHRPEGSGAVIYMDAISFMLYGPGRFANGTQSALVSSFMNGTFLLSNGTRQEFLLSQASPRRAYPLAVRRMKAKYQ